MSTSWSLATVDVDEFGVMGGVAGVIVIFGVVMKRLISG